MADPVGHSHNPWRSIPYRVGQPWSDVLCTSFDTLESMSMTENQSVETESMHITPVSGNVFADLGFTLKEATELKAQSQRIISEDLARTGKHVQLSVR